jgi:hypothetical protein
MKRVLVAIGLAALGARPGWAQSADECVPSALNIPESRSQIFHASRKRFEGSDLQISHHEMRRDSQSNAVHLPKALAATPKLRFRSSRSIAIEDDDSLRPIRTRPDFELVGWVSFFFLRARRIDSFVRLSLGG